MVQKGLGGDVSSSRFSSSSLKVCVSLKMRTNDHCAVLLRFTGLCTYQAFFPFKFIVHQWTYKMEHEGEDCAECAEAAYAASPDNNNATAAQHRGSSSTDDTDTTSPPQPSTFSFRWYLKCLLVALLAYVLHSKVSASTILTAPVGQVSLTKAHVDGLALGKGGYVPHARNVVTSLVACEPLHVLVRFHVCP